MLMQLMANERAATVGPVLPGPDWKAFWNNYPGFDDENNLSLVLSLNLHGRVFLFPGDLEAVGWKHLLQSLPSFREVVKTTTVLVAAHHGRESGLCTELFDNYGCSPRLVVISDDYHQYDTQKTCSYYKSKTLGIDYFRSQGKRWVLTTRSDRNVSMTSRHLLSRD